MHDIRLIRQDPTGFDARLARRGFPAVASDLIAKDERRRHAILNLEQIQSRRNEASKKIGEAKKNNDGQRAQALLTEVNALKDKLPILEDEEKRASRALEDALVEIPNIPFDAPEVPDGKDERDNVQHHRFGAPRGYAFVPKQHFELGEALGQMDFETATKLSGARFVVLKKALARLERALGQFFLDVHTSEPHNYTEVNPPLMVRDKAMIGTAQLPKFRNDQFQVPMTAFEELMDGVKAKALARLSIVQAEHVKEFEREMTPQEVIESFYGALKNDMDEYRHLYEEQSGEVSRLWLIPTAEVPLTNLVRESIVDEAQLPMRLTACTPCFRAEAGAAGRDTRGMIRQHQFTKVELVSITTQEQSKDEHERMLACAEEVLKKLDLHYRVVTLCAGDMGFASQKTYDIEVWLPGQGMFREISSCSTCGEFQARRMNARYKTKEGKNVPVHTLNGSGVAVGRAMVAVMETYQQEDGSIAVPDALAPYMGGIKKIEKAV
jgi:seryl-tRNA synthetase